MDKPRISFGEWIVPSETGDVPFPLSFKLDCPGCGGVLRPWRFERDGDGSRIVLWACLSAGCEFRLGDEF